MPRAIVLLNPQARLGGRIPIRAILRAFRAAHWEAEVWAGDTAAWAGEAAQRAVGLGVDAVFGAGGDGLLANILPAVIGTPVALGVVPLGTGNVWARELGIPLDVERALAIQLAQPAQPVDVGRANGRPFLVIASAGFDAEIVREVESRNKGLGQFAYPLAGVTLAGTVRGTSAMVTFDDEPPRETELLAGIATNGRLYGGRVSLVPDARIDDGLLHVMIFEGSGPADAAAHMARIIAGLHGHASSVIQRRVRRFRIETAGKPLQVQMDGDPCGTTPLDVEVLPGSLLALGAPGHTAA